MTKTKHDIDLVSGEIDQIIEHQIRGAQIRATLNWINEGERPTKVFLNIEKLNSNRKHIKRISKQDGTLITGHNNIISQLESFYKKLYTTNRIQGEPEPDFNNILGDLYIIKLSDTEKGECEGILKESELLASLKTTQKSPANYGLPSEFYKVFWNYIKVYLLNALHASYKNQKLSITQRRGVITLLPKKD